MPLLSHSRLMAASSLVVLICALVSSAASVAAAPAFPSHALPAPAFRLPACPGAPPLPWQNPLDPRLRIGARGARQGLTSQPGDSLWQQGFGLPIPDRGIQVLSIYDGRLI